jgi:phage shock protein PspC (stress-responsive transcriptional regulator)
MPFERVQYSLSAIRRVWLYHSGLGKYASVRTAHRAKFQEIFMSIADELTQLEQLRDRGSLSADEFQRAKNRLLTHPQQPDSVIQAVNGLRRSGVDRWIGGVCGGLANATGVAPWLWRMVFALLLIAGGTGLVAYLILWFFVPLEAARPLLRSSL